MTDDPAPSRGAAPSLRRIDHVGVIVDDLGEAIRLLGDKLGLEPAGGSESPVIRTAFFRCGDTRIEVIEVLDPERRRERLGEGAMARIEHIAIEVDDLHGTLAVLEALGIRAGAAPRVSADYLTFWTDPATSDGIMLQFLSRSEVPSGDGSG
jgi:methylmalonyl-CoA/ethylmalonyl-CoA epimerase